MLLKENYKQSPIWRKSMDLAIAINHAVRTFPDVEREYKGLSCQLIQTAIKIPSRIAESKQSSPYHPNELLQLARFHLSETEFLLEVSLHMGYLTEEEWLRVSDEMKEVRTMINQSLKQQLVPNLELIS